MEDGKAMVYLLLVLSLFARSDVNRTHATDWLVSGVMRAMRSSPAMQTAAFETQQRGKWLHKKQHQGPRLTKSLTLSSRYTIASMFFIVVLGLCRIQMMSRDFWLHCYNMHIKWYSIVTENN